MPHSFGYRAGTRATFKRPFRENGTLPTQTYLTTYKLGDIVDVVGCGSQQKGMPHKYYHGKTGVVWNITPRAIGVMLNKMVRHRIMQKRIHVRFEHLQHSKCRVDFLARMKANEEKKKEAKATGVKFDLKRKPIQPSAGRLVKSTRNKKNIVETLNPEVYGGILK